MSQSRVKLEFKNRNFNKPRAGGSKSLPSSDHQKPRQLSQKKLPRSTFSGGIDELGTNYFDCSSYQQADRYVVTTKAIHEYVGRTYHHSGDIRATLENLVLFQIPEPVDPAGAFTDIIDTSRIVIRSVRDQVAYLHAEIFKQHINAYVKRQTALEQNVQKAYSLVCGQCTELMKNHLRA